jgi:pyridoxine 5-phosphate synthase
MTQLSVNLNKVALLRNSRNIGIPSILRTAELCVGAGAQGITVHPRPDRRHIRPSDVYDLSDFLKHYPQVEFNIEGNPFPEFLEIVRRIKPAQCTLVPDGPDAITSDHGWDLDLEGQRLETIIAELHDLGARVSIFMDAESIQWGKARELGADRVELYTQPYAEAFARNDFAKVFEKYAVAAKAAQSAGLGVNAGHDLNLQNLGKFCEIPRILEVSIGHALVADALEMGMTDAVGAYLAVLTNPDRDKKHG